MVRELSLEKCTKEKCKQCDMGYILRHYIKPIMQCMTNDIKDYYMRLLTTKCLNSAVLISVLMLGRKGKLMADRCDSNLVQEKHHNGSMNNTRIFSRLKSNILRRKIGYRILYYILITDAEFEHEDGNKRYFPGHVFVLEKIPDDEPYFYFHQSYINQYDYNGHIKHMKNSLRLSYTDVENMMEQIHYVLTNSTWDKNMVKYWKKITFVDTSNMLGAKSGGKMFLCYQKSNVTDCIDRLNNFASKHLRNISKMKLSDMNNIYGDKNLYDSNQEPLTVKEIKFNLENLQKDIIKSHK